MLPIIKLVEFMELMDLELELVDKEVLKLISRIAIWLKMYLQNALQI